MNKIKSFLPVIEAWTRKPFDEETRNEIKTLINNKDYDELYDRFVKGLEFGTGGMRGIMGAGLNRMNVYTVATATKGLGDYLLSKNKRSVVVSFDTRNNSKRFSDIVVKVLSNMGIKTFYFTKPYPTPFLSFMSRRLNSVGVMITASHNPPEYNGYKVFWDNGVQVLPPNDLNIINSIKKIKIENIIKFIDLDFNKSYSEDITGKFDNDYLDAVLSFLDVSKFHEKVKILYSPLYGTGRDLMLKLMNRLDVDMDLVEEESSFDGNFPTVKVPNPEDPKVFELALKKARNSKNAYDLIIATDPDADRVGVWARHNNDYLFFNGNQIGTIILYYLLSNRKYSRGYAVTTIVSSDIIDPIARDFGIKFYRTLTGFKYIGEIVTKKKDNFVFGYEESFGYLIGDYIGDKDGISAAGMIAEICSYLKKKGMSFYDYLDLIYKRYGYYYESLRSVRMEFEKQKKIMEFLRKEEKALAGFKIREKIDLWSERRRLFKDTYSSLPKSNVLIFYLEGGYKLAVRPSGTEPKIKFYFAINSCRDVKSILDLRKDIKSFENRILHYVMEGLS